jgi:WD40 repeat protein
VTHLAAYPLPHPAQECLHANALLPAKIARANCTHTLLAANSSDLAIKLYNYRRAAATDGLGAAFEHFTTLRGHTKAVHDIKFHGVHSSYDTEVVETFEGRAMLSSCSEDGTVKFWDVRQQNPTHTFTRKCTHTASAIEWIIG